MRTVHTRLTQSRPKKISENMLQSKHKVVNHAARVSQVQEPMWSRRPSPSSKHWVAEVSKAQYELLKDPGPSPKRVPSSIIDDDFFSVGNAYQSYDRKDTVCFIPSAQFGAWDRSNQKDYKELTDRPPLEYQHVALLAQVTKGDEDYWALVLIVRGCMLHDEADESARLYSVQSAVDFKPTAAFIFAPAGFPDGSAFETTLRSLMKRWFPVQSSAFQTGYTRIHKLDFRWVEVSRFRCLELTGLLTDLLARLR